MAVSAISSSSAQVTPVARSVAPTPQSNSATSTIVVSKVTITNSDGSTTTIITYADGHTDTETTRAPTRQPSSAAPASAPPSNGSGRGQFVNLLA